MKAQQCAPLDPQLQEIIQPLSPAQLRKFAKRLRAWAQQLDDVLARETSRAKAPFEHASDHVTANAWISLGLTRKEVKALTTFGKRLGVRRSPCASAARWLIASGLLERDRSEARLRGIAKYMEAEDFCSFGVYMDRALPD